MYKSGIFGLVKWKSASRERFGASLVVMHFAGSILLAFVSSTLVVAQTAYKPLSLTDQEKGVLSSVAGRSVLLCATAKLTILNWAKDAEGHERLVWGSWVPPGAFDHLKPIPIADVEKVGAVSDMSIWSIRLGVGERRFFTLRSHTKGDELLNSPDPLALLVKNADGTGSIYFTVPSYYSPYEISVIQRGEIERGISELAMECSIGFPEETNDYGRAGKQHVYMHGSLLVYTDESSKIVEIQRMGQ